MDIPASRFLWIPFFLKLIVVFGSYPSDGRCNDDSGTLGDIDGCY